EEAGAGPAGIARHRGIEQSVDRSRPQRLMPVHILGVSGKPPIGHRVASRCARSSLRRSGHGGVLLARCATGDVTVAPLVEPRAKPKAPHGLDSRSPALNTLF